ncbi:MAG: chromosome partitioning protein ParB [Candidatus Cloacimonetes bacterium]|nr:chromosome partitioning protein ParB [Candidatus Cloacimonadota bacterium]
MGQLYCESDGKTVRHEYEIDRIWKLSDELESIEIDIEDIVGLDSVTWFNDSNQATIRSIAHHAKRIMDCDLTYPPILTEDNRVFDGMHRIAKHLMLDKKKIVVKKFLKNPEPDRVIYL